MAAGSKVSQAPPRLRGIEPLASRDNRWLRRFRAALRGGEAVDGCVGVEGPHLVEEALRSGLQVEAVLVSVAGERHFGGIEDRLDASVRLLRTSDRLFAGLADTETPQGIAALVRARPATFDEIVGRAQAMPALVVVLVGV
ncbi:MAG TPA: RNA methyltransferase substrate-binding domain-containing protein, partial [Candidatus Acidoferrales bacterium]|nr:RNA methyltransferase substrate-binding domain-containing protein [Candidatus Acidoferrales bacterium]